MSSNNTGLTRRDFINGAAVGVAGAALGGLSLKEAGANRAALRGRLPPNRDATTGQGARSDGYGVAHEMALRWHTHWGTPKDAGS